MKTQDIRASAIKHRLTGKSYLDINKELGVRVPKSTLSYWFKDLKYSKPVVRKIETMRLMSLEKAREKALRSNSIKRQKYISDIINKNSDLGGLLEDIKIAKISLAILFLAEGSKRGGVVTFGNSDPYIIELFLHLMRVCYRLDERKFRCTVQCRSDQDVERLEIFWSSLTTVPRDQFSKAQVDKRTVRKPTKKMDYRGVCRIDYHSAHIFNDLSQVPKIIYKGH